MHRFIPVFGLMYCLVRQLLYHHITKNTKRKADIFNDIAHLCRYIIWITFVIESGKGICEQRS